MHPFILRVGCVASCGYTAYTPTNSTPTYSLPQINIITTLNDLLHLTSPFPANFQLLTVQLTNEQ